MGYKRKVFKKSAKRFYKTSQRVHSLNEVPRGGFRL